ncbi:HlyC/CorC family transporter [Halorarum halophilum]|uniref:HlyC/CorC family transporter n=1 Tax=Halorarum halophilum TaxID=2743090 RepID=A0A7D5L2T5_9EURY|nr:hemolysin family protein [Halobaculum halophilum]QLG28023.1 HlyC/CorC family transporter [Halobaculum halophilum]
MVDLVFAASRIGVALFLVFLNGFFVAAEFALVRLRPVAVDSMVEEGRRFSGLVQEATRNLDDYLAVCQLGITISSLGLGWIGEPAVAVLVDPLLGSFLPESAVHAVSVAVGFGIVTFFHVVYGELAPKTVAIQEAERVALLVAPPMKFFYYLFVPGIIVFNGVANLSTRLIGVSPASESEESHTEEEILSMLSQSGEAGRVDAGEVEMIERIFDLDDTIVREIMRPRPDVTSVPSDTPLSDLQSMAIEAEYTRYPVVDDEDGDQVIGFVDVKDILRTSESLDGETGDVTANDLARDLIVVPETLTVDELLTEFQSEHRQMAAVIDEWGSFEGLVTIEDVVEEIVGDIRDQFDLRDPEPSIEPLEDGDYAIDGSVPLVEVNEALNADFESDGFETVGGFVLSQLGRAPEVGDSVDVDGYRLRVEDVEGARVMAVSLREIDEDGDGGALDDGADE